jgi:hypothetical protein
MRRGSHASKSVSGFSGSELVQVTIDEFAATSRSTDHRAISGIKGLHVE